MASDDRNRRPRATDPLVLVALSDEQIVQAKATNGPRTRPTHALVCGTYGQVVGTELQCRKYYEAWKLLYVGVLFPSAFESDTFPVADLKWTPNLATILIEAAEGTDTPSCLRRTSPRQLAIGPHQQHPTGTRRQPPPEERHVHRRVRRQPTRPRRPRLLPAQTSPRQRTQRSGHLRRPPTLQHHPGHAQNPNPLPTTPAPTRNPRKTTQRGLTTRQGHPPGHLGDRGTQPCPPWRSTSPDVHTSELPNKVKCRPPGWGTDAGS